MRAPFQVLVFPFRRGPSGAFEFAVFLRRDHRYWQAIAGGGEGDETPLQAAKREAREEAAIPEWLPYYRLQATAAIPVHHFAARAAWPPGLDAIPEHCFAVDAAEHEVRVSDEHAEVAWVSADAAQARLHWPSNRVALSELSGRLRDGTLESAE
jgi:dATP pyrophosphohydrolase